MSDERDVLSSENLARYEVPKPPTNFADDVMRHVTAKADPVPSIAPRRRWRMLAGTLAAAAAGVTIALFVVRGSSEDRAIAYMDRDRSETESQKPADNANRGPVALTLEPPANNRAPKKPPSRPLVRKNKPAHDFGLDRFDGGQPDQGQRETRDKLKRYTHPNPALVGVGKHRLDVQDPKHNTEAYSRIDDSPYHATSDKPLSTFSIDVDTASYANVRRFLNDSQMPPKDAVRLEEMINYFRYAYPAPAKGEPFSITTDVATSPWNAKYQVVRVGIQAPAIDDAQVPARNLVFLLDVSGSMNQPNKLPLLKQAMGMLVENLRPEDKVSIVVYAGASGIALRPTKGNEKDEIRNAITRLEAGGSTDGASGIQLAYNLAEANKIKGGINRVILCTDGDFNVGITDQGSLTRLIERERERGVFLTVLGFGMGNLKDSTLELLADRGNGNYGYIDSIDEARKVLVKEAGATLVTVAKDVKLQVEFNPAKVAGYRLIGYENRLMRDQDFNDDKKDAGDIGAGHSVTALYEIIPAGVAVPTGKVDDLKYQTKPVPSDAHNNELLTVKIRYKAPDGKTSKLLSRAVETAQHDLASMSADFRWSTAIASFGMMLRESPFRGNLSWRQVIAMAEGAIGSDAEGYRASALQLITTASKLKR